MSSLATVAAATYVQVQQLHNDLADHIDWSRGHICDLGTTQAGLMADVHLLDAVNTFETRNENQESHGVDREAILTAIERLSVSHTNSNTSIMKRPHEDGNDDDGGRYSARPSLALPPLPAPALPPLVFVAAPSSIPVIPLPSIIPLALVGVPAPSMPPAVAPPPPHNLKEVLFQPVSLETDITGEARNIILHSLPVAEPYMVKDSGWRAKRVAGNKNAVFLVFTTPEQASWFVLAWSMCEKKEGYAHLTVTPNA
ncbi:hypothetical protein C8J56DRAFT_1047940 [Mycena floridula]|nr:hypothetical protein C8J56DRAFT_1047940 [Mycena floridula]